MNESTKRKLNATKSIIDAIPSIIEAFVTFYGEKERERITNKFKNMLVIGYYSPDDLEQKIRKSNEDVSKKLITDFLEKYTENEKETETLYKFLFGNYSFEYKELQPINKYLNYKKGINTSDYNKQQVVDFLQKLYPETTIDNLDELIKSNKFKDIEIFIPFYKKATSKYKKYQQKMKIYNDYVTKCKELKSTLNTMSLT